MSSLILPFDKWNLVAPIVTGEFGNSMPTNPNRSSFVARLKPDGDVAGFVHVETLYHFAGAWVAPDLRGNPKEALSLMGDAVGRIPQGFSGLWLSDGYYDRIANLMGARLMGEYAVYRKDV
jgi:hypothetical protein